MNKIVLIVVAIVSISGVSAQISNSLIYVQGGSLNIGGNELTNESPINTLSVSSFEITKFPITVGQYYSFCKETGRSMPKALKWGWQTNHPMVYMTYYDALDYCRWLSKKSGDEYKLPTKAQWEYAALGGAKSKNYLYSGSNNLREVAWVKENARGKTNDVGRKKANELGIYDMIGNTMEWTSDRNNSGNPIVKGCSWKTSGNFCRITDSYHNSPN